MKTMRRRSGLRSAGLGLALLALGGCQTWVAGMTLPSGRYLQHPPQYIPPSPPFPLSRELASQEAAAAAALPGGEAGALPVPLPPAGPAAPAPPVAAPQ
jgi:hypothetical protein